MKESKAAAIGLQSASQFPRVSNPMHGLEPDQARQELGLRVAPDTPEFQMVRSEAGPQHIGEVVLNGNP